MPNSFQLPEAIYAKVMTWVDGPIDDATKAEILFLMQNDPKLLIELFGVDLQFGTSGLRALMGIGTNRINPYTAAKATQGVVNYLIKNRGKSCSVAIGYDTRHNSELLACTVAQVFKANGMKVFFLNSFCPTPFLAFVVRYYTCDLGIMITASHNPKEYNGYKIYGPDGGELTDGQEKELTSIMDLVQGFDQIQIQEEVPEKSDVTEARSAYLKTVFSLQCQTRGNQKFGADLKIIYSSLHGTGIALVPDALKSWGFKTLHLVASQVIPDGNFPTVKEPNPESQASWKLGVQSVLETKADLLILNDGDADRIGIGAAVGDSVYIFNGNEFATIVAYYLCVEKKRAEKSAFIISHVTTELVLKIAESFGIACFEVLTGFKYVAEKMASIEKEAYQFIFGAEESYGCLLGTYIHDKDGIAASCLISEIALHLKRKNQTLLTFLHRIYQRYGVFREKQHSLCFSDDQAGLLKRESMMQSLRDVPLKSLCGKRIMFAQDYEKETDLPKSDVLLFRLEDGTKIIIRPSGTEPKLRIHIGVQEKGFSSVADGISKAETKINSVLEAVLQRIG